MKFVVIFCNWDSGIRTKVIEAPSKEQALEVAEFDSGNDDESLVIMHLIEVPDLIKDLKQIEKGNND